MNRTVRTKHVAFLALILLLPWVSACTESDAMNALTFGGSVPAAAGGPSCTWGSGDSVIASYTSYASYSNVNST